MAQLVARFHGMEEARGSNPLSSTHGTRLEPLPMATLAEVRALFASAAQRSSAAPLTYFYNSDLEGAMKSLCGPTANLSGYTYDTGSSLLDMDSTGSTGSTSARG